MIVLLVALGAAIGAPARYLIDRLIQAQHATVFPWGTITVNIVACFGLGLLGGLATQLDPRLTAFAGTGVCASVSTYSTFNFETVRLIEDGDHFYAMVNVTFSLASGIGAAAFGWILGHALIA